MYLPKRACCLSPFWRWLHVQPSPGPPRCMDWWYMVVKIGVSSADSSLSILQGILSGPDAFFTLSPASNFSTPLTCITRSEIRGVLGPAKVGISASGDCGGVKTDLNCLFKMSALSFASAYNLPTDFKEETHPLSPADWTSRNARMALSHWIPSRPGVWN